MKIVEVHSTIHQQQFCQLPYHIYKKDPHWIAPLENDIHKIFDPSHNKFFRNGACKRWLVINEDKVVGRIAAFHHKKYIQKQPTGGIGFFECAEDYKAAQLLFDTAIEWLAAEGMEAVDGPINFGERDQWWGLLVEGFYEPLYNMNYNPPYYQTFFEQYGFQLYFKQYCYAMKVDQPLDEKFYRAHEIIARDDNYKAIHFKANQTKKFAKDFVEVYNAAFAQHGAGKTLSQKEAEKLFSSLKQVIDEKIIWFAYYKDRPIACWINIPDLNQYFKHLKGQFGWWQKLTFLFLKFTKKIHRFVGIVFAVIPAFQGKGVDSFLIIEAAHIIKKSRHYTDFEMQWIGDFNPRIMKIAENLGTTVSRVLHTYRYMINKQIPFERHPIVQPHKEKD